MAWMVSLKHKNGDIISPTKLFQGVLEGAVLEDLTPTLSQWKVNWLDHVIKIKTVPHALFYCFSLDPLFYSISFILRLTLFSCIWDKELPSSEEG